MDKEPKNIIYKMSFIQQTSFLLESATPLIPQLFFPIAAVSNIGMNISFTGFGAINAKVIQKLKPDNVGETYTKLTAVNTLGSSIGMAIGLGITIVVPDHSVRLGLVPLLGIIRIYSLHKSIEDIF